MRVLLVGDSPLAKTGFGRVNSHALEAMLAKGWEVGSVTGLQVKDEKKPLPENLPFRVWQPEGFDTLGLTKVQDAVDEFKPDIIYHTGEPGTTTGFMHVVPARIPFFAYVPVEGEPIVNRDWQAALKHIDWMTCSKYGADIAKRDLDVDVPWVYHGVDHEVFRVNGKRDETREKLGWTGKFVVMTVAQNVRRKQHPRLIEAISILKHQYGQRDVILYDHTVPFQNYWLEGWNLSDVAQGFRVYDEVFFNPLLDQFGAAVPEVTKDEMPSLPDLYNAADLFVLPSQVEGFGLPLAEAMACGLPVMTTKYAAGWEVAAGALGVGIEPHDWEVHKSGARYANLDPMDIASAINAVKKNPRKLATMRAAGLRRAQDFQWDAYKEALIDQLEKVASAPPRVSP